MNIGNWSDPEGGPQVLIGLAILFVLQLVFSYFAARYLRVVFHRVLDKRSGRVLPESIAEDSAPSSHKLNSYLLSVVIEIGIIHALCTMVWYAVEPLMMQAEFNFYLQRSFNQLPFMLAGIYSIQVSWEALITWRKLQNKLESAPSE